MALGVDGVRIGTWTHPTVPTGCTVILPPERTVGAIAVRGSSPGTREAAALGPAGKVSVCHGVALVGGSAYGLAVADGVMRWLEARGIGYETRIARVPIIGAAVVLDLGVAFADARPDAASGMAACDAASEDDPREGAVGAGTGTTVAKVAGFDHAWRGGQGIAVRRAGDLVVGAVVVNNAVGEVVAEDGTLVGAARVPADAPRFPVGLTMEELHAAGGAKTPEGFADGPTSNTAIGCIVTNARLDKAAAHRVADRAHGGIVLAVRPAHTSADGDAMFTLATGQVDAHDDRVTALAVEAVAEAARRGPLHATSLPALTLPSGDVLPAIPGLADA